MNIFWCNLITIFCLVLLIGCVCYFCFRLFVGKREKKLKYLRNFKKGKCIIIYLIAIPLYFVGYSYGGEKFFSALFQSIARVVNLVVLKFEFTGLTKLIAVSKLFEITVYFTFIIVSLNALVFAFSLFGQRIAYALNSLLMKLTKKDCLFIFGDHEENKQIYKSEKTRAKQLLYEFSDKQKEELYFKKINHFKYTSLDETVKEIISTSKNRDLTIVINYNKDEDNVKLCAKIVEQIKLISESENAIELMKKLHVYIFGNPDYEAIYFDFIRKAKGCMHYLNKYQQIAVDFIDKYPFTSFMNENHLDYSNGTLKNEVNVNVVLIGFGKTNRQIFLTSVANNQFVTKVKDEILLKKVNYHIFDKDIVYNKNLNHNYYRMLNEMDNCDLNDYLPFPEMPANENYHQLNINDNKFYNDVRRVLSPDKKDVNFIIIALGSDLENLDMAKKLCEKRDEWDTHSIVFVKAREEIIDATAFNVNDCYYIGNENEVVYNINKITGNNLIDMAMLRNFVYDLENKVKKTPEIYTDKFIANCKEESTKKWYLKKMQFERESSIYCCLSLRSKLNMLNLDYTDKTNDSFTALTEEEYFDIYAKKDKINYYENLEVNGKRVVKYNGEFKPSIRKNMATLEHYRWNSFMITKGFIPASKKLILTEKEIVDGELTYTNGRNYRLRRHGNLTNFDGLVTYAEMVSKRDNSSLISADVICYDYQILDDAFWLLDKSGKKIYKRNQNSDSAVNEHID